MLSWPLYIFNSLSVGIDFIRQNLTSTDVRFRRIRSVLAVKGSTWLLLILRLITIYKLALSAIISSN